MITASLVLQLAVGQAETHGEAVHPVIPPTVWGILVFVTMLAILWWKAFPPITAALDRRARLIQESLEAAERAKREAEEMMKKHEASLEKARAEARAIIEEGKSDAQRVKEGIIETARRESEELAARAKRDIQQAKVSAMNDLLRQSAELSLELARKVIHKELKPEDHEELIEETIRKYQKVK